MKILVTGAKGFVGRNLCAQLGNIRDGKARWYGIGPEGQPDACTGLSIDAVFGYDIDSDPADLDRWCAEADFVFNLAGVNRPKEQSEFMAGNFGFASTLLQTLEKHGNTCPVMLSSSQQASLTGRFGNSEYGRSKKAGEDLFLEYGARTGARVLVYRFPNLFGKWCRPNYNSAVATFCNNIANDLPIQVNDRSVEMELLYIDDLVDEMIEALKGREHRCEFDGLAIIPADGAGSVASDAETSLRSSLPQPLAVEPGELKPCCSGRGHIDARCERPRDLPLTWPRVATVSSAASTAPAPSGGRYCYCPVTHRITLGEIVDMIYRFAEQPKSLMLPEIPDGSFAKKLYSTYLSYLPKEKVAFPLKMNVDQRGSFTELLHTPDCGQVSINISKPGITKGQHWHNTKWEFFIVVAGHGLIQERPENPRPDQTGPDGQPEILEFEVSGDDIRAIHMLPGYTHNIINLSDTEDLVTVMWCNEIFDPNHPDTFFDPVK